LEWNEKNENDDKKEKKRLLNESKEFIEKSTKMINVCILLRKNTRNYFSYPKSVQWRRIEIFSKKSFTMIFGFVYSKLIICKHFIENRLHEIFTFSML
jgi:hypothetical protein